MDALMFFNLSTAVISFFGFMIFVQWWVTTRKATIVYIYILLLIFAIGVENLIEFYFRYNHYDAIQQLASAGCSVCAHLFDKYWMFKGLLVFVVISIFMLHMIQRIYHTMFKIKKIQSEVEKYYNPNASFFVLIVEDDLLIPAILGEYISKKSKGASVVVRSSAEEALEYLGKDPSINMILCDIALKGKMTGFDLIRTVKKSYPWIINICMTGYPGRYSLHDARKEGFDDYFIKPFRLDDIAKSMNYHRQKMVRWGNITNRADRVV